MAAKSRRPACRRGCRNLSWLRDIVDAALAARLESAAMRACYLAFAREFLATLQRRPQRDFGRRTKRVVMKWFKRGLSGRLLWLIGSAIIEHVYGG